MIVPMKGVLLMDIQPNGGIYRETLRRFRTPIGHGCAREAYYSQKFKLVFKTPIRANDTYQTEQEKLFFDELPEKYQPIFPVVDFVSYNQRIWIVMRRVRIANDLHIYYNLRCELREIEIEVRKRGHEIPNIGLVREFLRKFYVNDLHRYNWGFDENWNIQIVDWGL